MEKLESVTQGYCPKCGSADIIYHGSELSGESMYYEAECEVCDAMLHEWYDLKFSGFDLMIEEEQGGGIPPLVEVVYFDEGDIILEDREQQEEKA